MILDRIFFLILQTHIQVFSPSVFFCLYGLIGVCRFKSFTFPILGSDTGNLKSLWFLAYSNI